MNASTTNNTEEIDTHISEAETNDEAQENEDPQDNTDIHNEEDTFNNENDQGITHTVDGQVESLDDAEQPLDDNHTQGIDAANTVPNPAESDANTIDNKESEDIVEEKAQDSSQQDVPKDNDQDKVNKKANNNRSRENKNTDKPKPTDANRRQPYHFRNITDFDPQQIKIDTFYSYNTTTSNQYNYKFVGGIGGRDFSVQKKNAAIHTIKIVYNMKRVTQMFVTFFDDKTVHRFGSSLKDIRE